ncbi:hypothetical protein jhhlp_006219 [Lomentospora prolificans]|uniref:Kinetoplast-associated protein KAP n=1 Tax=Lomentospora prolificans TaxID=41688 RepID=A0A2N3N596_9PEZI|nr:hypothetical protein jhhlp_006219 [Lomentospora prolificans]
MASAPLSPAHDSTLNIATPQTSTTTTTSLRQNTYEVTAFTTTSTPTGTAQPSITTDIPSLASVLSPRDPDNLRAAAASPANKENVMSPSPSKMTRHSRVLSGTELSPLKILSEARSKSGSPDSAATNDSAASPSAPAVSTVRSPRKVLSPVKRFPIKVRPPGADVEATPKPAAKERTLTIDEALRDNAGLQRAIQIFEDENDSPLEDDDDTLNFGASATSTIPEFSDEAAGPDDTMVSTFSTFSAVPSMTTFANLHNSATKQSFMGEATPRASARTHRANAPETIPETGNTTNLLMEFTEQLRFPQKTPSQRASMHQFNPAAGGPPSTPGRSSVNLIDFDIPPMPTPRSIPSITPRELESLKSNFLSEISSLKASLSGKEAEVHSLKAAVADAERRAGESMEQLREERSTREHLSAEKDGWEKRGREMESVLRKVKDEIVLNQREREELEIKLDESEKRREAAEMMAQEAESKIAGMKAGKATEERERAAAGDKTPVSASATAKEVEIAVERVARELHALYKSKHETKVTALKKSYENRWEKRVRELEAKIEELADDNERLRMGRDATMTRVDPNQVAIDEERKAQLAKDSAQIKELEAEIEKLEAVVSTVKMDNSELRQLLEQERVEKGELVQVAEELMAMQQSFVAPPDTAAKPAARGPAPSALRTPAANRHSMIEAPRSATKSGLRAPGSYAAAESKIGRSAVHERTKSSGIGGLPRPRSGIMSSIEKMGNYRGRGGD